jgi:hypothetical protein
MSDSIFPTLVGADISVERTQEYDTKTQIESGGRVLTISSRTQAVYRWSLTYNVITATELTTLSAFQHSMGGRKDTFLFSDPLIPSATLWPFRDGVGTGSIHTAGDGAQTVFYLCDPQGDPIPSIGALAVYSYVNGVLQSPLSGDFSAAYVGGGLQVTFTVAPPNGHSMTWSGGYYRRARFADDSMKIKRIVSDRYSAKFDLVSQVLP